MKWEQIVRYALDSLSDHEKEQSTVYLDQRIISPNEPLQIEKKTLRMPYSVGVLFVDLEPELNWGHRCLYLLVNLETGEVESIKATHPPFLKGPSPTLRLVWKGKSVPEWTLAVK